MKIIITGATGFVGGAMLRHFSSLGHEVIGFGRNFKLASKINHYGQFQQVDITEKMSATQADICIHCAGVASDQASYSSLHSANVLGTENVFQSIDCNTFIHISSSSVYNFTGDIQHEKDLIEIDKLQDYGKTKRLAELFLIGEKCNDRSIFILRPRAIYGIGDRLLMPRILSKCNKNKLIVPGDMNIMTSLTHIDNLIEAVELCMTSRSNFEIYNVSDQSPYNLREAIGKLLDRYYEIPVRIIPFPLSFARLISVLTKTIGFSSAINKMAIENLSQSKILDISKIRNYENYSGNENYFNALPSIVNWLKSIPKDQLLCDATLLAWLNVDNKNLF